MAAVAKGSLLSINGASAADRNRLAVGFKAWVLPRAQVAGDDGRPRRRPCLFGRLREESNGGRQLHQKLQAAAAAQPRPREAWGGPAHADLRARPPRRVDLGLSKASGVRRRG